MRSPAINGYIKGMLDETFPPTDENPPQTWEQWLWSTIAWDGFLPLIVATSRLLLPLVIDDKVLATLIGAFFIPLFLALFRAHRGKQQLETFVGSAAVWRQIVLAVSITILFLFEALVAALISDPGVPILAWIVAASMYAGYLFLVGLATWPKRRWDV